MPNMSGFEFLSIVRKRFPNIPTIAISGAFSGRVVPESVLADAFFEKGQYSLEEPSRRSLLSWKNLPPAHGASIEPSQTPGFLSATQTTSL
jgi:hypothetical protein